MQFWLYSQHSIFLVKQRFKAFTFNTVIEVGFTFTVSLLVTAARFPFPSSLLVTGAGFTFTGSLLVSPVFHSCSFRSVTICVNLDLNVCSYFLASSTLLSTASSSDVPGHTLWICVLQSQLRFPALQWLYLVPSYHNVRQHSIGSLGAGVRGYEVPDLSAGTKTQVFCKSSVYFLPLNCLSCLKGDFPLKVWYFWV